jgi:uncharacterized protein with ParB-like and HNH nuclease domain
MQAQENNLRKLLESNAQQYMVPLFQRFYVWEKPSWQRLWDDLTELLEEADPQQTHFLGSVVVIPVAAAPGNLTQFVIIDGQQRLATLLLLLTVLRDHARHAENDGLATEIQETLLVNKFQKGEGYYKLRLSQDDRLVLQNRIDARPSSPDHLLTQCYHFYDQKLKSHPHDLRTLLNVVADRLSVVTITLATQDNPYRVFESLNFKGHKLTEADLIRNYLFMGIPPHEQEQRYAQYWAPMQEALDDRLTDFVRHHLMRSGAFIKQSEVYVTLKNRVPLADATTALKELALFAGYYAKLLEPTQEPNTAIRAMLTRLNRLEVTTVYPFLLNLYRDYAQQLLSAPTFVDVLKTLENYLIRRFVCGLATNQLNKIFPGLYAQTQAQNTGNFVQALQYTLQGKGYPSDMQFRAKLPEVKLYGHGQLEKKGRFLLETLETQAHKEQIIHLDRLTIEHVMPQTLTAEWRAHLGDDAQTTHDLYLHTLGNLTLTGYNSELSNAPYAVKRQKLAHSHLALNDYFQPVEQWRAPDIQQRAEVLTEQALQCWPYFGDAAAAVSAGDTVTGTFPESITVLGNTVPVKTWREVLSKTLETLALAEPVPFAQLPDQFPTYIATRGQGFRSPKSLSNGYFIETNLGAASIHRFCQRAVAALNLPPEAWTVQVKPATKDAP